MIRVVFDAPAGLTSDVLRVAALLPKDFPHVREIVDYFGGVAEDTWVQWALGKASLPDGRMIHARSGAYAASIKRSSSAGFENATEITQEIATDSKYHDALDSGLPEMDLKKMLLTSLRVRMSKHGKRYLIIPFRHATSGKDAGGLSYGTNTMAQLPGYAGGNVMPKRIVDWFRRQEADGAAKTSVVQSGMRSTGQPVPHSGAGQMVPAFRYSWGARYAGKAGEGERSKLNAPNTPGKGRYAWKSGLYAGMVHTASREYRTFRTMSESSDAASWIKPPQPGLRILQQLGEFIETQGFEDAVAQAVEKDFAHFVEFFGQPQVGG